MRRALHIDAPSLLAAAVARDEGLLGTYLDLQRGVLLRVYDPSLAGHSNDATEALLDADPDRYAKVPLYIREYRLMTEFVDRADDDLARQLDAALAGREAFRRFEVVLAGWPEEQARWRQFREDALVRWLVGWLHSLEIDPIWDLPVPVDEPFDVPWLLRVALRGGSDGTRSIPCEDLAAAKQMFMRLARELCELRREPVLTRTLRNATRFARGGIEIRREGTVVTLAMDPP